MANRVGEWLRAERKKTIGPRSMVRRIRRHPVVLMRFLGYLVGTFGLLLAVLAIFGEMKDIQHLWQFPLIVSAGLLGGDLYWGTTDEESTS